MIGATDTGLAPTQTKGWLFEVRMTGQVAVSTVNELGSMVRLVSPQTARVEPVSTVRAVTSSA